MFDNMTKQEARKYILDSVASYVNKFMLQKKDFQVGDKINYSSRNFDEKEIVNLVDSSLEFWLTEGRFSHQFEDKFSKKLGVKHVSIVNSGSSANLLAFMALTSHKLPEDRRIKKGDEVITVAESFPTTISPIVQFGAIPVFVDIEIGTYNIDVSKLEAARSEKTKAVMIAHTLGNPFNLQAVKSFCDKYNLWLVEDNCDALGATYTINGEVKFTGTIGDLGTSSFYPAHQITMGEGGAVYTNNPLLHKIVRSLRDWGRDCSCPPGCDNSCGHRFSQQHGDLPLGFDHKYVYSHFGYNLKVTDMQASVGLAQLDKLFDFVDKRRKNWSYLVDNLKCLENYLVLPTITPNSNPSWFGCIFTIKENNVRAKLIEFLEGRGIQTRTLFAGNIIRHPCFKELPDTSYRVVGDLTNTDNVMNNTLWVGVHPGMQTSQLDYIIQSFKDFFIK